MISYAPIFPIMMSNLLLYPPEIKEPTYVSCSPNATNLDNEICHAKYGECRYIDSEWLCVCNHGYYNLDKNVTKGCRIEVNQKASFIVLTFFLGIFGISSSLMGWFGIYLINIVLLIILALALFLWCFVRERVRYTPQANTIEVDSKNKNDDLKINWFIVMICILLVIVWLYTLILTIVKPVNDQGIENI